jgi:hypothetical protein
MRVLSLWSKTCRPQGRRASPAAWARHGSFCSCVAFGSFGAGWGSEGFPRKIGGIRRPSDTIPGARGDSYLLKSGPVASQMGGDSRPLRIAAIH